MKKVILGGYYASYDNDYINATFITNTIRNPRNLENYVLAKVDNERKTKHLDLRQHKIIEYLSSGEITQKEISEELEIHRNSISQDIKDIKSALE